MRLERFELSTNSLMVMEMRLELIFLPTVHLFWNCISLYDSIKATALPAELQSQIGEQFRVMLSTETITLSFFKCLNRFATPIPMTIMARASITSMARSSLT